MQIRRPFIAGNWKMYKTNSESLATAKELVQLVLDIKDIDIMIAPAFTALSNVYETIKDSCIQLGAQNLFYEKEGAYTGEISPSMLVSTGCQYVIIGHSERRQYFGESDQSVNLKIKAAIQENLMPILCVGETEDQRESKKTFSILDKQIKNGLKSFVSKEMNNLVLAYEPVWAIGSGKTATSDQVQEVHEFLRSLIEQMFGKELSASIRILYGGSVKPSNINELMSQIDVDGALVGGASLDADSFSKIIHFNA